MRLAKVAIAAGILVLGAGAYTLNQVRDDRQRIVTGKYVSPSGEQTPVGSFPINMATSPDGRYMVVTNIGFRQQLSVLDAATGKLVSRREFSAKSKTDSGLYYGLAFGSFHGRTLLYASEGAEDVIAVFELSSDGELKDVDRLQNPPQVLKANFPHHIAGLAVSADGNTLYAVNNQSHEGNDFTGSLSFIDLNTGKPSREVKLPAFPFAAVAPANGPRAGNRVYVSCERDGQVAAVDTQTGTVRLIRTGGAPASLLISPDGRRLFVTNSLSDTLTTIDLETERVSDTLLLRQGDLRGIPGVTPLGMAIDKSGSELYVALADMNAVAVIDLRAKKVRGLIDVGWYPTSVAVTPDDSGLLVANAKGVQTRNPNGKPVGDWGTYAPNILEGTVSMIRRADATANMATSTQRVLDNNLARGHAAAQVSKSFHRPPIKHVIYVIKENRTYDQVMGDLPQGNGDASLCLFPREVTPNQHALAERFGLLDNFFVCAEVSYDGWTWSTQGMTNAYIARNVPYNYSGRGRSYDGEGDNNGRPVDLMGMRDMGESAGGYFWEHAQRAGKTFRNYGFFVDAQSARKDENGKVVDEAHEEGNRRSLVSTTCQDFREFDMAYPDSNAWIQCGVPPAPKQMLTYGRHRDRYRMSAFEREFAGYVRDGKLPELITLRLPRNHTSGTTAGLSSPRAMVADNDYAVGRLVDMVSHSPFWKDTAICILEDDAQAGTDHVDCHRSPAMIVSAYSSRGKVDSRFYNTDSMLRTMELLLGLKPMNSYDAIAAPIDLFTASPSNVEPYTAILPNREIVGEVNTPRAYRSKDSERLLSRYAEESAGDVELNDILWGAIKGPQTPRPVLRGARWRVADLD